jgi:mycothiol synthase
MAVQSTSSSDTAAALRFVMAVEQHTESTLLSDELRSQLQAGTAMVWEHQAAGRTMGWAVAVAHGEGWSTEVVALLPSATEQLLLDVIVSARTAGARNVRWWTHVADPSLGGIAGTLGFSLDRRLLQLRVDLPLTGDDHPADDPHPVQAATRPFRPGDDDEAWLVTNNTAFAWHGEQGGWTLTQFRRRCSEPWFDSADLLVLDAPLTSDGGLAGFCWTKQHADLAPMVGEIYIIAVHPSLAGRGLGRALTTAGLNHLYLAGARQGMLYVDETNRPAVAMYRRLGFITHHTDVSYLMKLEAP